MPRTSSGMSAISAMPPALSVTGPKASSATIMPAIESIATTAIATPSMFASLNATRMPTPITITGAAVASIDLARPAMMFVACPVVDARAMPLTGPQRVPV